jgi:hypothetical protein
MYVSPLVAIGVCVALGPWQWMWSHRNQATGSPDRRTRARVEELSAKLGIPPPNVFVNTRDEGLSPEGITMYDDVLILFAKQWKALPLDEQDFLLARKLASRVVPGLQRNWILQSLITLAASAIACLSLWWILILHSGGLTAAMWTAHLKHRRQALELDVAAVRATGDLEAARRYLRSHSKVNDVVPLDMRLANLDTAFG